MKTTSSTKSKSRRERAAAVRSQLWEAAHKVENATAYSSEDHSLSGILQKMAGLEALVIDLHWMILGQWQQSGLKVESDETVSMHSGTGQVGSALCPSGFGSGVQFVPAEFLGAPAAACEAESKTMQKEVERDTEEQAKDSASSMKSMGPKARNTEVDKTADKTKEVDRLGMGSPWMLLTPWDCKQLSHTCFANVVAVEQHTPLFWEPPPEVYDVTGGAASAPDVEHTDAMELDCQELEALYQRALRECPENVEAKFQQLHREEMNRKA